MSFNSQIGWKSSVAPWMLPTVVVGCALFAIYSTVRWLRSSRDRRTLMRRDLAEGKVSEERDYESQDLAVQEKDPFGSSLRPRSELLLVRAPDARFIVSQTFTGDGLPTAAARELTAPPKKWPEPEEFCSVPWNELESVYG